MSRQINILLEEEVIEGIERLVLEQSKEKNRVTMSDVIRQAICTMIWHPEDREMNRLYTAILGEEIIPLATIDLYLGDKASACDVGCYEILFSVDNDKIKRVELNALIRYESSNDDVHPSLFSTYLSDKFLERDGVYDMEMKLTTSKSIDDVSRFTEYLNGTSVCGWQEVHDLGEDIKRLRKKHANINKTIVKCGDVYDAKKFQTVKMRCRKYIHFPGTAHFGDNGWLFSFSANTNFDL